MDGDFDASKWRKHLDRLSDVELDSFCLDHFPKIYGIFARGQGRVEKMNLLLDHCRRNPDEADRLAMLLGSPDFQDVFVNREKELLALLPERLKGRMSPYVLLSAPAGYGKSYLLKKLIHDFDVNPERRHAWTTRYIQCPDESLDQLPSVIKTLTNNQYASEASQDAICSYLLKSLAEIIPGPNSGRKCVLIVLDDVDKLADFPCAWLADLLFTLRERMSSVEGFTIRFIFCGRNLDGFWARVADVHPLPAPERRFLTPFDQHAIQSLIWKVASNLGGLGLSDEFVNWTALEIEYLSGGHPKIIRGMVAELAKESFAIETDYFEKNRRRFIKDFVAPVARELLKSVPADLHEALKQLSIFRLLTGTTIEFLEEKGASFRTDAVSVLGDLVNARVLAKPTLKMPFYQDHLMRRVLALAFSFRSPRDFERRNQTACEAYAYWMENLPLDYSLKAWFMQEWLFHLLQADASYREDFLNKVETMVKSIAESQDPFQVRGILCSSVEQDLEISYLMRRHLDSATMSAVIELLQRV